MSNIISIKGYRLQVKSGRPMIPDLDLATRLEYAEPRPIRKLIKRMLEKGQIKPEQVRSTMERLPNGANSTQFELDQHAAIKVITKSETQKADEITDEVIDVFLAFQSGDAKPKRKRTADPVIAKNRQAVSVLQSYKRAGKILGTGEPMTNVLAVEAVHRETGVDFRPLLGNNQIEEKPVTPTDLGLEFGVSPQKVNAVLAEAGLQAKTTAGWEPTERGKKYGSYEPYKSKNSDHTGYRMMWYPSKVKKLIQEKAA